jgi:hypothetical protein
VGLFVQLSIPRRNNDQETAIKANAGLVVYWPIERRQKTFMKPFENINYLKTPILVNSTRLPAAQETRNASFRVQLARRTGETLTGPVF